MMYEDKYCSKCVHQNGPDGKSGCAVWLSHILYAYKLCNEKDDEGKHMLDFLIPEKDGFADKCAMFHAGAPVPDPRDLPPKTVIPAMREWAEKHGVLK